MSEQANANIKKPPFLTKRDERSIQKELDRMRVLIDNGTAFWPEGIQLSEESKDSIMAAMRLGFEAAKLKNKETYTPKKYKKE